MNVTNFWQSLELKQAGLDWRTADFYYDGLGKLHYPEKPGVSGPGVVPAWSLGQLWICVGKVATFSFQETDSPNYIIEKLIYLYKEYGN